MSTSIKIHKGEDAFAKLAKGVELATRAVSTTYGPFGRTVCLERQAGQITTKDGLTVLMDIHLKDSLMNMGINLVRNGSLELNNLCGDGSTTFCVLINALVKELYRAILSGQIEEFISDLNYSESQILEILKYLSIQCVDPNLLHKCAMLSSNGDVELSEIVSSAFIEGGPYGHIDVVSGNKIGYEVEEIEGVIYDRGWASESFSDGAKIIELEDPVIAIFNHGLTAYSDVKNCMEYASQFPGRPLVVIAPYIFADALKYLNLNRKEGVLECYGALLPEHHLIGQTLVDSIVAMSGAILHNNKMHKSEDFNADFLGGLSSIKISKDQTIMVPPIDNEGGLINRIHQVRNKIPSEDSPWMKDWLSRHVSHLSGGLTQIKVCCHTESETMELRGRIEDTLNNVRNCMNDGVVPGSTNTYSYLSYMLSEVCPGVARALKSPMAMLCENAGIEADPVLHGYFDSLSRTENPWHGWNVSTQSYIDLQGDLVESHKKIRETIRISFSIIRTLSKSKVFMVRT